MAPKAAPKAAAKQATAAATKPAAKQAAATAAPKAAAKQAPAKQAQKGGDGSAIYIKGLNQALKAADVYEIFGTYGKIKEVRVRSGRYALVWFDNQASAKKAQELNGKNVKGSKVSVEGGRAASRPNKEEVATSVWVGKLPGGVNKKQLIELVKGFGKIHKIRLSEKKHQAFVYFEDNAVAKKAVAGLAGKDLRGAKVEAKLSIRSKAFDAKKLTKRPKVVASKAAAAAPKKAAAAAAATTTKPAAKAAASAAATKEAAKPAAKAAAAAAPAKTETKPAGKAAAATPAKTESKPAAKPAAKAAAAKSGKK